jgi:hypothetical protein
MQYMHFFIESEWFASILVEFEGTLPETEISLALA